MSTQKTAQHNTSPAVICTVLTRGLSNCFSSHPDPEKSFLLQESRGEIRSDIGKVSK